MRISFIAVALVALHVSACGGASGEESTTSIQSESNSNVTTVTTVPASSSSSGVAKKIDEAALAMLKTQRELWDSWGVQEYEITLSARVGNALPIDVVLHVNEGKIIGIKNVDAENPLAVDINNPGVVAIPKAYAAIESAATLGFHQLNVEYDATYGFPTRIFRDYRVNWSDDQDEWKFRDFVLRR